MTLQQQSEREVLKDCLEYLAILRTHGTLDYWRIDSVGKPCFNSDGTRGFRPNNSMPGFSDLLVLVRGGPSLFIEVKGFKGKQSPFQRAFQARIQAMASNRYYAVVKSVDELITFLNSFGYLL